MSAKRIFYIGAGSISLVLGCIGIPLPVLPTVPFFLLTMICFAKSSPRLHKWFINSALYKNYLSDFLEKKGTPIRKKIMMIVSVTFSIGLGFFLMPNIIPAKIIVFLAWFSLMIYVIFILPTAKTEKVAENQLK